jgi:hypothetical protein
MSKKWSRQDIINEVCAWLLVLSVFAGTYLILNHFWSKL